MLRSIVEGRPTKNRQCVLWRHLSIGSPSTGSRRRTQYRPSIGRKQAKSVPARLPHVAPGLEWMSDGAEGEAGREPPAEAEKPELPADLEILGIERQGQWDRRTRGVA